jgi:DNA-binding response OmpR family regulator
MANIFLVEDEAPVALVLKEFLEDMDHNVVQIVAHLDVGLMAAEVLDVDIGVLDVRIIGGLSFPIANKLIRRNIPVLFVTGTTEADDSGIPALILRKPFTFKQFELTVEKTLQREQLLAA